MKLYLDLEAGDTLRIGDSVLQMEHKTGKRARFRITSTEDVRLHKSGAEPEPVLSRPAANTEPPRPAAQVPLLRRPIPA